MSNLSVLFEAQLSLYSFFFALRYVLFGEILSLYYNNKPIIDGQIEGV